MVYGATNVSPTRVLPDKNWQIPLAFVLITNGQSTVVASNISDARIWITQAGDRNTDFGSVAVNQTFNCQGASQVVLALTITAALTLTLTNLRVGVPVQVFVLNSTGGALTFKVAASAPSGTAIAVTAKIASGGTVNFTTVGLSLGAGGGQLCSGNSYITGGSPLLLVGAA